MSQAKLVLPTSLNGGDDFLFGNIQTKSGTQFVRAGSKISYTRCREILSKKLADVGLDCASFSWHSSRSGGVSSVANGECLRDTGDGVRKTLKMVMLQTR